VSELRRQRRAQLGLYFGHELRRLLRGRGGFGLLLLAGLPLPILGLGALVSRLFGDPRAVEAAASVFGAVFQVFLLRAVVFFGCVAVFTHLFRGEILARSLHYVLLLPLRRELVVAAKYLAGLVATSVVFGAMVVVGMLLTLLPAGLSSALGFLLSAAGLAQLGASLVVVVLACAGYGAIFLLCGLLVRNPILPAALILGWEGLHFLLPPLLKRLSVIHYLRGWIPSPLTEGPFAILSPPPSGAASILGIVLLASVALLLATWRLDRLELDYSE